MKSTEKNPDLNAKHPYFMSIGSEYDNCYIEYYSKPSIDEDDRPFWKLRANREFPDIKSFRECVSPITRSIEFANMYLPSSSYVKPYVLLSLISQHFKVLGLLRSVEALIQETTMPLLDKSQNTSSQISYLIQKGVLKAENFWNLTCPSNEMSPNDIKNLLENEIASVIGFVPKSTNEGMSLEEEIHDSKPKIQRDNDGTVLFASINQLIYLFTSEITPEIKIVYESFLISYRSIISPHLLLLKICERFRMCHEEDDKKGVELTFAFFRDWIQSCFNDIEPRIMDYAREFAEKELPRYFKFSYSSLFHNNNIEVLNPSLSQFPCVLLGDCENRIWDGTFEIHELPPLELARQITLWTSKVFYQIETPELIGGNWGNPRMKHRSPNIVLLNSHSNALGNWASHIILSGCNYEDRLIKMNYILKLIGKLWKMNNIFDSYSLLGGLTHKSITRLQSHWDSISTKGNKLVRKLEELIEDPQYRELKELQLELAIRGPAMPFFVPILNDLIHQKEVETFNEGMVVISKMIRTYQHVKEFNMFKKSRYNYLSVHQIQEKLDSLQEINGDYLYQLSLEVEPKVSKS